MCKCGNGDVEELIKWNGNDNWNYLEEDQFLMGVMIMTIGKWHNKYGPMITVNDG